MKQKFEIVVRKQGSTSYFCVQSEEAVSRIFDDSSNQNAQQDAEFYCSALNCGLELPCDISDDKMISTIK